MRELSCKFFNFARKAPIRAPFHAFEKFIFHPSLLVCRDYYYSQPARWQNSRPRVKRHPMSQEFSIVERIEDVTSESLFPLSTLEITLTIFELAFLWMKWQACFDS